MGLPLGKLVFVQFFSSPAQKMSCAFRGLRYYMGSNLNFRRDVVVPRRAP
jgi:hypothetical protein